MRTSIISALTALALACDGGALIQAGEHAAEPPPHAAIATEQAKLSLALLTRLAGGGSRAADNIIVSPASLSSVLALISQGADKGMTEALAHALGFDPKLPAEAALQELASARASWTEDATGMIEAADKLVLDPTVKPYPLVRKAIESLGAQVSVDDLSQAEAVSRVNDWVKATTHGLIPQILDAPLDKPGFVALNALHFKGTWRYRFDPDQTKPAPFTGADGKRSETAMMHLPEGRYAFRTEGDHVGVDLPFNGDRFSLIVVTTRSKPAKLRDFESIADWLTGSGFSSRLGRLDLPRLNLSGREELMPALDALGLEKARRSPTALAGFAPGTTLARITQRAVLEVNEEGAEAAAATAAVGERGLVQEDEVQMTVDKPFVYALRDRRTGLVVIAGYVGNLAPSKTQ